MRPFTRAIAIACAFALHVSTIAAGKCAAPPIALPYRNTSFAPGHLSYGIPIQIGSPPQYVALTPNLMLDQTFIPRYTNGCINSIDESVGNGNGGNGTRRAARRDNHTEDVGEDAHMKCAEIYGGGYLPALSQTWKENKMSTTDLKTLLQKTQNFTAWESMDETFAFVDYVETHIEATRFLPEKRNLTTAFILPDENTAFGNFGSSPLGLTPNSTLLAALEKERMIPSTSWSLTNDTLCLGCADGNAHTGDFQIFKPADREGNENLPCLLQAKVEKLYWYPRSGVEGTYMVEEEFSACIDPGVKFLVLPDKVREYLEKATEREVLAEEDDHITLKGSPGSDVGSLSFRLEGGLVVNVTVPGTGEAGGDGEWKVPIGKGGWGAYGSDVWTLGKPFTDKVVLRWDGGQSEYGIANVNEDPGRKEDLKPLGCDEFPEKAEKKASSTASAGAIAGSAVGGFVGGLVFALAGLWFFKRGKKGVMSKYEPMRSEEVLPMGAMAGNRRTMDSMRSGVSSIRTGFSSTGTGRVSPLMEPQMMEDGSIYEAPEGGFVEAPEGGTAYPTKRAARTELGIPSIYQT